MSKRPSAAMIATGAKVIQGEIAAADRVITKAEATLGYSLDGIMIGAWALKAGSHLVPSFGAKYRSFLGTVGLRP